MPTYVYKFIDTDETVEIQQSFTDDTLTEYAHPETGETMPVKKVFLPVGVTFKGDGFYKTDNRSGAKKSDGATGGDSGSSSSDSSKGSDSSTSSDSSKSSDSSSSSTSSESTKSTKSTSSSSTSSD
ncbi:MAG: FmdB family transcriptional regulator [Ilumatobacteraceae bacterium]|nr:FmdB family transcriptional regulator [Ilumatobacteraceae bacterium]